MKNGPGTLTFQFVSVIERMAYSATRRSTSLGSRAILTWTVVPSPQ